MNQADKLQNRVDELQKEIQSIQNSCEHIFECTSEPVEIIESLVPLVYLGMLEGPVRLSLNFYCQPRSTFSVTCTKCSLNYPNACSKYMCPRCFSKMKVSNHVEGASREKYFGERYIYYGIVRSTCTNPECRLTVASDEWDQ